jgi:hypothetical protein
MIKSLYHNNKRHYITLKTVIGGDSGNNGNNCIKSNLLFEKIELDNLKPAIKNIEASIMELSKKNLI